MTPEKGRLAEEPPSVLPMGLLEVRCEHAPAAEGQEEDPVRQSPRSVRNRLVYSSGVVLETELQVGDAKPSEQGVSRSKDQKCSPARPLLRA
jgi:hypothetical protein